MCLYIQSLKEACQELAAKGAEFDMVDICNKTRELAGLSFDIKPRDCKIAALEVFEQGNLPGYVMTTKEKTVPVPVFWEGVTRWGAEERSVFSFVPVASLVGASAAQ